MNYIGWIIFAVYAAIGAIHSVSRAYYVFKSIKEKHGCRYACETLLLPGIAVGVFAILFWPIDIAISIIHKNVYGGTEE